MQDIIKLKILTANLEFKSGILASCNWSFVGNEHNSIDKIEIFGTKGMLCFSISTETPILLKIGKIEKVIEFEKPKHVELPMIKEVVSSLLGKNSYKSNMESAVRTSLVMDKIMNVAY